MKNAVRIPYLVAKELAIFVLAECRGKKPVLKPDGRRATRARRAARERLDSELAAITQGVPEFRLLARVELDTCSRSRNDWKTRDPSGRSASCEWRPRSRSPASSLRGPRRFIQC